ncbi:MAG: ABC transporter substrate-binding protein [Actinophytocola sp.]|uniref:ABC transporter substrate-binding protein n=1 Tax=Actinophytocola sp. TaxID=1872138 RepID=UPI003C72EC89
MNRLTVSGRVSRRNFLAGSAGVAAIALLAACGDDESGGGDGGTAAERDVRTDKGTVTVPAKATKVACADFFGAFAVVDLGLVPVAASGSGYEGTGPRYETKLAKVPLVGDFTVPDPEKVADTEPDLILRTIDTDDALYKQLTGIAPTVVISFQKLSLTEVAAKVGEVLGRKEQADKLLAEYEDACEKIKSTHADVLGKYTFTFAQAASDTTFWTLGEKWTDTKVLVDCGVTLAEPSAAQAEATEEYSMERISVLDKTDVLLIPSGPDGVTEAPDNKPLTSNALWAQLPAAKAGRVWPVLSGAASLGTALELVERFDTVLTELAAKS